MPDQNEVQNDPSQIDYSDMVRKLAKTGAAILPTLTAEDCHLIHMIFGIVGEYDELLCRSGRDNTVEELGDLEFYCEGLRQLFNLKYEDVQKLPVVTPTRGCLHVISGAMSKITDLAKKPLIYRKEMDKDGMLNALRELEFGINAFRDIEGITRDECLLANKVKLAQRYSGFQYSDAAAQARADKPAGE